MTKLLVWTAAGVLKGMGLDDIVQQIETFSAANPPHKLQRGESYLDNKPFGVPVQDLRNFSSSTDINTALTALESGVTSPCYAYVPQPYFINTLQLIGTNAWYGYANSNRKVMGFVGDGPGISDIRQAAGMIPSAARAYALAPADPQSLPLYSLYLSNTSSTAPIFISGIGFDGMFQGPYGVQTGAGITVNASVPSPIPHHGLALWRTIAGSRVQFSRFRGFAHTQKASPPLELAGLESNYDNGLVVSRTEIDGRLPTGELSAGGYMANFTSNLTVVDSWLHDTRRSGYAIHEHGGGDNGTYLTRNFQVEGIANVADGFAGSGLGFHAANIEEVSGRMTFDGFRAALDRGYHLAIATTAGGPVAKSIDVSDFTSLSTAYNGCLAIRIIKTPNSQGTNPYWDLYNSGGFAALPIHVTKNGKTLTPVASTSFQTAVHTPDKNYVVVTS